MFYRLKSQKFTSKNLDMTQDKTDVKTRSKQKAREDNKHGAGSGQRQKMGKTNCKAGNKGD